MKHPLALLPLAIVTSMAVTATTSSVFAATSSVASGFVARDIRIEGLVRLSPASVSSLLPIASGDTITEQKLAEAISCALCQW